MSAAAPDTWMPLWIGPYLANTLHLNRCHHGSYILLILAAWKAGGSLPDDDATLATIAKCTAREWRAERCIYAAFFTVGGGKWIHERVVSELVKAAAFKDKQRQNGSQGGRPPKPRRNPDGTQTEPSGNPEKSTLPLPQPSSGTTTPSVANSALTREPVSRSHLLTDEWEPSDADIAEMQAELPYVKGTLFDSRMKDFRDWCAANATRTFNPAATWRGFMRKTPAPKEAKRWDNKPDPQALPPSEPWEQRVTGWVTKRQWLPNLWGPPPGDSGCRVPPKIVHDVTEAHRP